MANGRERNGMKFVPLAGDLSQGATIDRASAGERVLIPASKIDVGEIVFRVRGDIGNIGILADDLLIVEQCKRGHAATAELVVVLVNGHAFIGHWWKKRGGRTLTDDGLAVIIEGEAMEILGAVNVIVRMTS